MVFIWVFIGIIGGIPVKRISESLFCLFFSFFFLINVFYGLFFLLVFIGIIGGPLINVFLRVYFDGFFYNFGFL